MIWCNMSNLFFVHLELISEKKITLKILFDSFDPVDSILIVTDRIRI